MRNFLKDARFALRTLASHPGFAFVSIVTLALGMAVNTTVFSVVNGFLLRPLPVPHPEQITVLALKQSSAAGTYRFSYPTYQDLRGQTDSFSELFAYEVAGPLFDRHLHHRTGRPYLPGGAADCAFRAAFCRREEGITEFVRTGDARHSRCMSVNAVKGA